MLTQLSNRTEDWVCASEFFRSNGKSNSTNLGNEPRCDSRRAQYPKSSESILAEISRDRPECDRFIEWEPSLSPKEHLQMFFQQVAFELQKSIAEIHGKIAESNAISAASHVAISQIQANYLEWQKQQSEEQRKWEARLKALEQTWHNEDIVVARKEAKGTSRQAWWAIIGVILAFLIGLPGFITWLVSLIAAVTVNQ